MNDFDRQPGAIDDPGMKGGIAPDEETLPPGDSADNTGGPGEPQAADPTDLKIHVPLESRELQDQKDGREAGKTAPRQRKG